jgi:hypothetical protein
MSDVLDEGSADEEVINTGFKYEILDEARIKMATESRFRSPSADTLTSIWRGLLVLDDVSLTTVVWKRCRSRQPLWNR